MLYINKFQYNNYLVIFQKNVKIIDSLKYLFVFLFLYIKIIYKIIFST